LKQDLSKIFVCNLLTVSGESKISKICPVLSMGLFLPAGLDGLMGRFCVDIALKR